jgi:GntR family transcriptional regulator, sialic acid-inducible nan operon repressor
MDVLSKTKPHASRAGLRAAKRHESVAASLEQDIVLGRIGPGVTLPSERGLVERFKVGRTTVREALLTLQRRGLIEVRNGVPARVITPDTDMIVGDVGMLARRYGRTPDGIRHLQHARALVETGLAREAALYASPEARQEIQRAFDENAASVNDLERFAETDVTFHFAIAKASQNPIFLSLHEALRGWLAEQRLVSRRAERFPADVIAEHRPILQAILNRDGSGAAAAMEAHLAAVVRAYWLAMTPAFARGSQPAEDRP